jgi:three-Cys-motif partner protein
LERHEAGDSRGGESERRTPMAEGGFFDECKEQSKIKAAIVADYFWVWANVVMGAAKQRSGRIAYIDLFAGPGRYLDGTKSTPLLILERAISDPKPDLRDMLVTIFNDVNSDNSLSLENAIRSLPGIDTLKYPPEVSNEEVGTQIVGMFEHMQLVPTLFFVDPWGYKGLSLRLVGSVIKDWGCDCIFFFNYNRINMGLPNQFVDVHMNALFGQSRADNLRRCLSSLQPANREGAIVQEICLALQEMGGKYVLPFCFKNETGNRTSHHLIFVSKAFKGYEIMKEIMAGKSSATKQGVPTFEYCPATRAQPFLFEISRPLEELEGMLLAEFEGQTLAMCKLYEKHNVGKRYIKRNYKEILKAMELAGKIGVNPPLEQRRKGTMKDDALITFPSRK